MVFTNNCSFLQITMVFYSSNNHGFFTNNRGFLQITKFFYSSNNHGFLQIASFLQITIEIVICNFISMSRYIALMYRIKGIC